MPDVEKTFAGGMFAGGFNGRSTQEIVPFAKLVVDTRNAMASVPAGTGKARVVKS